MSMAERPRKIGASESAALFGLSPWLTALHVWERLVNGGGELPVNEAMEIGLLAEPLIAELYTRRTGKRLEMQPMHQTNPGLPDYIMASPDRLAEDGALVELKMVGPASAPSWGQSGTDDCPEHYIIQAQHQLLVTGRQRCDVAALICGQELRVYPVDRNEIIAGAIISACKDLWYLANTRQPPPPDFGHAATAGLLAAMYGFEGGEIEMGEDVALLADKYAAVKDSAKELEQVKDELKARMLYAMGEAMVARLPDGRRLRRNRVKRAGYEVGESIYIDFRILKARKGATA